MDIYTTGSQRRIASIESVDHPSTNSWSIECGALIGSRNDDDYRAVEYSCGINVVKTLKANITGHPPHQDAQNATIEYPKNHLLKAVQRAPHLSQDFASWDSVRWSNKCRRLRDSRPSPEDNVSKADHTT